MFNCKICKSELHSLESLAKHYNIKHTKNVRCTLCFLKVATPRILKTHYMKNHSKSKIVKQFLNSPYRNVRPMNWSRVVKKTEIAKEKFLKTNPKTEKLYVNGNIHITCGNKDIFIETSSDNEESLEVSIDNAESNRPMKALLFEETNVVLQEVKSDEKLIVQPKQKQEKPKRKIKRPKNYKHFCVEFVKSEGTNMLDHKTGEFYTCKCRQETSNVVTSTSDTESSSDNGKYSFHPLLDKKFYCDLCGNGYKTKSKLFEHRKIHNFHCRTCGTYFPSQRQFSDHVKHHISVYCCHVCKLKFSQESALITHLNFHQEQEVVRNVLDLEQNYAHYLINFNSESYASSINKITMFLSTGECNYNPDYYNKVRCHICHLEFFKCDFPQHMKIHYILKNSLRRHNTFH